MVTYQKLTALYPSKISRERHGLRRLKESTGRSCPRRSEPGRTCPPSRTPLDLDRPASSTASPSSAVRERPAAAGPAPHKARHRATSTGLCMRRCRMSQLDCLSCAHASKPASRRPLPPAPAYTASQRCTSPTQTGGGRHDHRGVNRVSGAGRPEAHCRQCEHRSASPSYENPVEPGSASRVHRLPAMTADIVADHRGRDRQKLDGARVIRCRPAGEPQWQARARPDRREH